MNELFGGIDPPAGERLQEIDTCKDCLFKNCFVEWGGTLRCMTSDGRNVNMAEELNRLEKNCFDQLQDWGNPITP